MTLCDFASLYLLQFDRQSMFSSMLLSSSRDTSAATALVGPATYQNTWFNVNNVHLGIHNTPHKVFDVRIDLTNSQCHM